MAKQKQAEKNIRQPQKSKPGSSSGLEKWYPLIIFLFASIIYSNSVFNDYNLDDELVTQNHRLTSKGISAIPEIFSSPYYEDKAGYKYEYRPVVLTSFAIEYSFFGDNAHVSHFINLILYALLCVILFFALKNLLGQYSLLLPFVITLLFTSHPVHTEVVASIKNRDEILSLIFGLLSLHFAALFTVRRNWLYLLFVPAFFLLGILAKSTTITFALLIPLSLIMFTQVGFARLLLVTAILAVPAVFYSRLYSVVQLLLLVAALFTTVLLLYAFKNLTIDFEKIKTFLIPKREPLSEGNASESSSLDFSFLKNKAVLFITALLILATLGVSFWGIYMGKVAWSIIPLAALILVYLLSRDEVKLVLITPISLITVCALIRIQFFTSLIETGLIIFLLSQILSPNKAFRITGIVNYVVYALVGFLVIHSNFFLVILFFIGFVNRKLFPVAIAAAAFSLIVIGKHVFDIATGNKLFKIAYLSLPIVYLSLFLLWKQKQQLVSRISAASIPLFMLVYFVFVPPGENYKVTGSIKESYYEFNRMKAPDASPVKAVRPLKFMEYPLETTDPFTVKLGTAMVVLGKYFQLIFVPYPLSYYYGYAYIVPVSLWQAVPLVVLLIHLLLGAAALFFIRKDALLSYSILFYLISVSVFSNLVMPIPGMMGDRFLLVPSIGFCCFAAACLFKIFKLGFTDRKLNLSSLTLPFKISLGVVLLLYSALTFSRNADWKNRLTLFQHDIDRVENSAQAQNLLGLHLFIESFKETDAARQQQMRLDAEKHLKRAVEIYPDFLNASFDLGRMYEAMKRPDDAYNQYMQTVKMDTGFKAPYFSMAIIQQNKGNLKEAIPMYEQYLTKYPAQPEVYANLSYAYFMLKEYDSSIAVNKRALNFIPASFESYVNIGKVYIQINNPDSAALYLHKALGIKPGDATVQGLLQRIGM